MYQYHLHTANVKGSWAFSLRKLYVWFIITLHSSIIVLCKDAFKQIESGKDVKIQ